MPTALLPDCPSRLVADATGRRFLCSHPRVHTPGNRVTSRICRDCTLVAGRQESEVRSQKTGDGAPTEDGARSDPVTLDFGPGTLGALPNPQSAIRNPQSVPQPLLLRSFQSPGDVVMLTAAARELHRQYPGRYLTGVRTSVPAIWEHNPDITSIPDMEPGTRNLDPAAQPRSIDMHYPLINHSNQRPVHFIEGYCEFLATQLGLPSLRPHEFRGHIYLSDEERAGKNQVEELTGYQGRFWLVNAGRKNDFPAKHWPVESFQAVVDHFRERLVFVQIGAAEHHHPPLEGVIDLRGKSDHRQLIRLVYHAAGVLTGVSYPMHLAAAVPRPTWMTGLRPCVVVAGGREPVHWEQYPGHQFLHTIGALSCCATGGCWKSRVVPLGDGDAKDRDLCHQPIDGFPRCMRMIRPERVIEAIEMYLDEATARRVGTAHQEPPRAPSAQGIEGARGWGLGTGRKDEGGRMKDEAVSSHSNPQSEIRHPQFPSPQPPVPSRSVPVLIDFQHGLGDAVQLTTVLLHLRHYHADWEIDVAAGVGKHSALAGLCRRTFLRERERPNRSAYRHAFDLSWDECPRVLNGAPSTKAEHCLRSVFRLEPRAELCRYEIRVGAAATAAARAYLEEIVQGPKSDDGRQESEVRSQKTDVAAPTGDDLRPESAGFPSP